MLYFLGPKGTNCEHAAKKFVEKLKYFNDFELKPVSTISKTIDILDKTPGTFGVLPIENSLDGIVHATLDNLYKTDVKILAQSEIEINHCLFSKGKKEDIKNIISHPSALAQCQDYIIKNFDENINLIEADSTSKALNSLNELDESYGAIGDLALGEKLNYNIIGKNISDILDNKTRFVLVSRLLDENIDLGKNSRTSIVFNAKNSPGELLKILYLINIYGLNLLYLESRPSKKVFGEYNFFADIEADALDIADALDEIKSKCNFYKLLGSYINI